MDFPRAVVEGLRERLAGHDPQDMARVTLLVNTQRMKARVESLFLDGTPGFLPRIRLITDLGDADIADDLPPPVSDLRRRLELRQLVAKLVQGASPAIAPLSAIPSLTDSLAQFLDEMCQEAVPLEALRQLDVGEHSAHWARSLQFLQIAAQFMDGSADAPPSRALRFRQVAELLARAWQAAPPAGPIIIAGSTGSRGTTGLLMEAVARLPQGAVILPGMDAHMPPRIWAALAQPDEGHPPPEDHPQYRFARLLHDLGVPPEAVPPWHGDLAPAQIARNALVSLALRPAPVTSDWLAEAPHLRDLELATRDMTLVEAETPREESLAIALAIREALELGRSVSLVTPDRRLSRLVEAALQRWGITADASMGDPLDRSAPGRLLRLVLDLAQRPGETETFLGLLKHPLVATGPQRAHHLRMTREFELWLRRNNSGRVTAATLAAWAAAAEAPEPAAWASWLCEVLPARILPKNAGLETYLDRLIATAEALVSGPERGGAGPLYARVAGAGLTRLRAELRRDAGHGGRMSLVEFADLLVALMQDVELREPVGLRHDVTIWGTLEARVQGAEVVILGGLNDGTWPELAGADPWLNRALRLQAGLLLPERRIGLAAHDFQQAIAAPRVILTRALRDAEAQTVPSRWLNRLANLLGGIEAGASLLAEMRARGAAILQIARAIETPARRLPPAPRPAPVPPANAPLREISVTEVEKLIRDPYAVYARRILGLARLNPIRPVAEYRTRGTFLHTLVEKLLPAFDPDRSDEENAAVMQQRLQEIARDLVDWSDVRLLWTTAFQNVLTQLLRDERRRRARASVAANETFGEVQLETPPVRLFGKADRIDLDASGAAIIYDYKTSIPKKGDLEKYNKQLWLEALIRARGAFRDVGTGPVAALGYIGISGDAETQDIPVTPEQLADIATGLERLLAAYHGGACGYVARRDPADYPGDFDHLARFGEWDDATEPTRIDLS